MRPPIIVAALCVLCASPAAAMQRSVKAAVKTFASTPVELQDPNIHLRETFSSPTQSAGDGPAESRVRYANRKQSPQLVLTGECVLVNRSPQRIDAVAVTTMPVDAFGEGVDTSQGQQGVYRLHRVTEPIVKGGSVTFSWEQPVTSDDVYEVAIAVTAVRFADGSVWIAPKDKLTETFFQ